MYYFHQTVSIFNIMADIKTSFSASYQVVQYSFDSGITNKLFLKCKKTIVKISLNCQNRFLSK